MTTKQAAKAGYRIARGAYENTTDNRIDGWYIDDDIAVIDRTGCGFRTKREALQALEERLEMIDAYK